MSLRYKLHYQVVKSNEIKGSITIPQIRWSSKGISLLRLKKYSKVMLNYLPHHCMMRFKALLHAKSCESFVKLCVFCCFLQKSGVNVKEVMDTWTLQMGLPVVTIARMDHEKAAADQKLFLISPGAKPKQSSPFK